MNFLKRTLTILAVLAIAFGIARRAHATAVDIIQTDDAIYIFTDGAFVDPKSGNLAFTGAKVISNPASRFAIAVSGSTEMLTNLGVNVPFWTDVEQAKGDIAAIMPKLLSMFRFNENPEGAFGVYVAGFTAAGERQVWKIEGDGRQQKFSAIQLDPDTWSYTPTFTPELLRKAIGKADAEHFERGFRERLSVSDPLEHGMLALEAQHRMRVQDVALAGGKPTYTVGAFAQVTKITRDKIESWVVKRWPDVVGAPIDPSKLLKSGSLIPAHTPLNARAFKSSAGIDAGASSNYNLDTSAGKVSPSAVSDVWSSAANLSALNFNFANTSITEVRTKIASGQLVSVTGDKVRVTFSSATAGDGLVIVNAFIGHASTGSTFDGNQVRLTFGGSNGATIAAGVSAVVSDAVDFSQFNSTKDLIVSVEVTGASDLRRISGVSSNFTGYLGTGTGGAGNNSMTGSPTGSSGTLYLVSGIEMRTTTGATNNMTLITAAQPADGTVDHGRVLLLYNPLDSITLNTDLTVEVSCDGGATWSAGTLVKFTDHVGGSVQYKGAEIQDTACAAGGTSWQARVKTLNNKAVEIYGLSLTVH